MSGCCIPCPQSLQVPPGCVPREVLGMRVYEAPDLFIQACETCKCSQIMILVDSVLTCLEICLWQRGKTGDPYNSRA